MLRNFSRPILAVLSMTAIFSVNLTAQEISAPERAKLLEYLTSTRDQVLVEAEKLTDVQWKFKPAPDRWSVGEVVEHLALSEAFIFDMQQKALAAPATPEQRAATNGKDDTVLKLIPDRTKKATAPEPLQPKASLGSQAEVLAAFRDRRAQTIEYAKTTRDALRAHVAESPLGPLDGYQWLLFMGAHAERHLAQIREVKAHAQFPKTKTE